MERRSGNIPVIDVSPIALTRSSPTLDDYCQVASNLSNALATWGFAYLTHHGVHPNIINGCFSQAQNFFALPQDVKDKYSRGVESIHGYSSKGREILEKNVVEAKESFDAHDLNKGNLPDDSLPKLRPILQDFAVEAGSLAQRLLRCLALDLQIDPDEFLHDHCGMFKGHENGSAIRLLHYPPILDKEATLDGQKITRCGKHSDYGGLTLLFQDSLGGLQVQSLDSSHEEWQEAPPIEGTIVVNIGDLLQFWSGGRYRATPHRVIVDSKTCDKARLSVAVFVHPDYHTDIRPFGTRTHLEQVRTAREHINQRFADTYKSSH